MLTSMVVSVALLIAVLLLMRYRSALRGASQRVTRTVWCPLHDRPESATLEENCWDGRRIDVEQCSAFSPPTAVRCEKSCLRLTSRPRPAAVPSIPLLF
jgi:hypothetical protein